MNPVRVLALLLLAVPASAGAGVVTIDPDLPPGNHGVPYEGRLRARGGVPPYLWTTVGRLPDGLEVSADGLVHGSLQFLSVGVASLYFCVRDAEGEGTCSYVRLEVREPPLELVVVSSEGQQVIRPFRVVIMARGGKPPYVFDVDERQLPPGVTATTEDNLLVLEGVVEVAGTYTIRLGVYDSAGQYEESYTSLVFSPGRPISIRTDSLPVATNSEPYNAVIEASEFATFALMDGSLPAGLILGADGVLEGTPDDAPGVYAFRVQATTADFARDVRALGLRLKPAGLEDTPSVGASASTTGCSVAGAPSLVALAALALLRRRQ